MIKKEYETRAWEETNILDLFCHIYPERTVVEKGRRYECLCPYHDDHHPSLSIEPDKHRIHCYSCGETYYTFGFLKKELGLSYPDAIRYIYEKGIIPGVEIKDIYDFQNDIDDKLWERKRKQYDYMEIANSYFRDEHLADNPFAIGCRNYAEYRDDNPNGRWTKEMCDIETLGYANASSHSFVDWAISRKLDLEVMVDLGLIGKDEKTGGKVRYYDAFVDRLMFPYRDERFRVVSFTGRLLHYKPGDKMKFKNCTCKKDTNLIFVKESTPWGLHNMTEVRKAHKAYLVEGPGDAMTLKGIGVSNVLASGGGQWTKGQLQRIKGSGVPPLLCFIPDIDENVKVLDGATMGIGESFVVNAGKMAMKLGFKVSVKVIPQNEDGSKIDAGEYFKNHPERWKNIKEEDFISWYASKYFDPSVTDEENINAVTNVCKMLLELDDEQMVFMNFSRLKNRFKRKDIWDGAMSLAKRDFNEVQQEKYMEKYGLNLKHFDLIASNGCLYSVKSNNSAKHQLTNFLPRPLYFIQDSNQTLRIVEVDNHKDAPSVIAFRQDELSSMDKCVTRLGLNGNYTRLTTGEEFKVFRALIYDGLKNASMANFVGWNDSGDDGFFVWGNGVFSNKEWIKPNEFGIIEYDGEFYYIPSCSQANENNNDPIVQNMKMYEHVPDDTVNMYDFLSLVDDVFAENGLITVSFGIATIFRDIIFGSTSYFPLLFIFGPNMTGKTTLAKNAMLLFMKNSQMTNIGSSSFAGLSRLLSMLSNMPVLLNEYFDTVGLKKIDMFKGIFEGTGRIMSSENNDSFTQFTAKCSLILTGQDLPNYDPAMFSRTLLVEQYESLFDAQKSESLKRLKAYQDKGLTNITCELLGYRSAFKKKWGRIWSDTMEKINNDANVSLIPQRVRECWAIMYAAIICLKECGASIPMNRTGLYNICVEYMNRQAELMRNSDEIAKFWEKIDRAHSKGLLKEKFAYRIETIDTPFEVSRKRIKRMLTGKEHKSRIIKLFLRNCIDAIESVSRNEEKSISDTSLKHYLENIPEYLGTTVQSTYFRMLDEHGNPATIKKENGETVPMRKPARPMVFNYDALCEKYGINLIGIE